MILISNHLQQFMDLPKGVVIRVNMAWVKDNEDMNRIILKNSHNDIFLDYPRNRSKYPIPTCTLNQAIELCNWYSNIKYFAVSNIETVDEVFKIKDEIIYTTQFVPKIETTLGVTNLPTIIDKCSIKHIMLDKEDLLSDLHKGPDKDRNKINEDFYRYVEHARKVCKEKNVEMLELQGVVFIGDHNETRSQL